MPAPNASHIHMHQGISDVRQFYRATFAYVNDCHPMTHHYREKSLATAYSVTAMALKKQRGSVPTSWMT